MDDAAKQVAESIKRMRRADIAEQARRGVWQGIVEAVKARAGRGGYEVTYQRNGARLATPEGKHVPDDDPTQPATPVQDILNNAEAQLEQIDAWEAQEPQSDG